MGANPQHDEPLRLLNTVGISLWVSQGLNLDTIGFLDFVGCSVADENGLASPFDNDLVVSHVRQKKKKLYILVWGSSEVYVLALGDGGEVEFNLGHSKDVG